MDYVKCFAKQKAISDLGGLEFSCPITNVDEETRKKLELLMKSDAYTIYAHSDISHESVAVADIRKRDECPDWLFEKVTKQILGNG